MAEIEIDGDGGGHLGVGPHAGLRAAGRTRNGERWLATPRLADDTEPHDPAVAARATLLGALADHARAHGVDVVHWETDDPEAVVDAVAASAGLTVRRDILQLRRPLPLEPALVAAAPEVALRPLRPGTPDEEAWVQVNNRSFASHPDQGHESVASLHGHMDEPWFDAAGLLLADGDPGVDAGGRLDGFCWTRVHPAEGDEPPRGEIYVIGVDPDATGRGLGRALTVAGLVHLARVGTPVGMLFVDADNTPARRLYDGLGFTTHHTRRIRSLPPT